VVSHFRDDLYQAINCTANYNQEKFTKSKMHKNYPYTNKMALVKTGKQVTECKTETTALRPVNLSTIITIAVR